MFPEKVFMLGGGSVSLICAPELEESRARRLRVPARATAHCDSQADISQARDFSWGYEPQVSFEEAGADVRVVSGDAGKAAGSENHE